MNKTIVGLTLSAGIVIGIFSLAPLVSFASGLFYIDSATGFAGFGNTTPQSQVDVSGAIYSRLVTASSSAIDWNAGNIQEMTLTSSPTLSFSSGQAGGQYTLILTQDATGDRSVTWPASVLWPDGHAPTLTSTANATDTVNFVYDGINYLGASNLNYQSSGGIAFDNKAQSTVSGASSLTYSLTTSGSNRILIVEVLSVSTITGVTYGGVSMTQATEGTNTADASTNVYLFYLKDPASGANNVVVSASGSSNPISSSAYSFTGAAQSGGVDTATPYYNSTAESGDISVSLSVSTANSWIFEAQDSSNVLPDAVVNGTFGFTSGATDDEAAYSNAGVGSGSQSIGFSWPSSDHHAIVALAFAPI